MINRVYFRENNTDIHGVEYSKCPQRVHKVIPLLHDSVPFIDEASRNITAHTYEVYRGYYCDDFILGSMLLLWVLRDGKVHVSQVKQK